MSRSASNSSDKILWLQPIICFPLDECFETKSQHGALHPAVTPSKRTTRTSAVSTKWRPVTVTGHKGKANQFQFMMLVLVRTTYPSANSSLLMFSGRKHWKLAECSCSAAVRPQQSVIKSWIKKQHQNGGLWLKSSSWSGFRWCEDPKTLGKTDYTFLSKG